MNIGSYVLLVQVTDGPSCRCHDTSAKQIKFARPYIFARTEPTEEMRLLAPIKATDCDLNKRSRLRVAIGGFFVQLPAARHAS